jgi:hypothetical protein
MQKRLLPKVLVDLRRRLSTLAPRSPERRQVLRETAHLYGVSEDTVYRALRERFRPRALRRAEWDMALATRGFVKGVQCWGACYA